MSSPPEQLLKKIRKLEANCTCPNCHTPAPRGIGFGSVCVKFGTFVCDMCKTSHQAISHRVKSVSMSAWTLEEVRALEHPQGGNALAAQTWLADAPAPGCKSTGARRPRQGDDIAVFKQFVVDCYERALYRSEAPVAPRQTEPQRDQRVSPPRAVASTRPVSVPLPCIAAPEVSLLDFDSAPDDFGSFASFESSAPGHLFEASFPVLQTPLSAQATAADDGFGDFSSAPMTPSAQDPFSIAAPRATIDLDALYQMPGSMVPPPLMAPTFGAPMQPFIAPPQGPSNPISSMVAPGYGPHVAYARHSGPGDERAFGGFGSSGWQGAGK